MRLSRADLANCVRAVLNFVLRRLLWLMPNSTTAHFLRETEQTVSIACWRQPGPGHSVNTFSCNVGLFQPKTFQVPVTDLYIFIKIYSEIGPMMHVLHTWCSPSPAASPVDLVADPRSASGELPASERPCRFDQDLRGSSVLEGLRFALIWNSLHLWHDTAFPSHQSILWILRVCGLIIIVPTIIPLSLFCLQGNTYLSKFSFFLKKKNSHILILL